jgi:hypothetical protein
MGWVISLGVKRGGERQYTGGAKLDAEATPFASLDGDGNRAFGHFGRKYARRGPRAAAILRQTVPVSCPAPLLMLLLKVDGELAGDRLLAEFG